QWWVIVEKLGDKEYRPFLEVCSNVSIRDVPPNYGLVRSQRGCSSGTKLVAGRLYGIFPGCSYRGSQNRMFDKPPVNSVDRSDHKACVALEMAQFANPL